MIEDCLAGRMIHLRHTGADNTLCGAYPKYYAAGGIKPYPMNDKYKDRHRCRKCEKLRTKKS